jgi:hypothetical protein
MFLGLEMPWEKIFWRPYLYKILVFMESYRALMLFLPCFVEVFSRARNVLLSIFSQLRRLKTELSLKCGGRLSPFSA